MSDCILDATRTVNDVIATMPSTVGVFNSYGIDACCGGAVSIRDAAERDGVDFGALMFALRLASVASRAAPTRSEERGP